MLSKRILIAGGLVLITVASFAAWSWYWADWLGPPFAAVPAEPVEGEVEWDADWDPPDTVDPKEFRQKYGKYFESEFMTQLAANLDPQLDVNNLRGVEIRDDQATLGTLFVTSQGKVALAVKYPDVKDFSEGLALVATTEEPEKYSYGNYGFIDRTGQLAIAAEFDRGESFKEGLAGVEKHKKWGFIDRQGKVVIPLIYDRIESFHEGLAKARLNDDVIHLIDQSGKVVYELDARPFAGSRDRPDLGKFSEGLCWVNWPAAELPQKAGYLNREMKLEFLLESVKDSNWSTKSQEFHEGLAVVCVGRKTGVIDRTGKFVIPPTYEQIRPFSEGLAAVEVRWGDIVRYGFIDRTGKMVIAPQFLNAGPFHEGLAPVEIPDVVEEEKVPRIARAVRGRWGYIDRQGQVIIAPQYYHAASFRQGTATVCRGPLDREFINKQGESLWKISLPSNSYWDRFVKRSPVTSAEAKSTWMAHVDLELSVEKSVVEFGENPGFHATLVNKELQAIVIIRPGMGSAFGEQTPIVRWKPRILLGPGCGGPSRPGDRDIIILEPGERYPIEDYLLRSPTLNRLGKHQVILEIENVPGLIWQRTFEDGKSTAMKRIQRSTPYKATSNPVEIEVIGPINPAGRDRDELLY
jgi:hypothetical protein